MKALQFSLIPTGLRERPQWVLWHTAVRGDKPTKEPLQVGGGLAKSNDPTTWAPFEAVRAAFRPEQHSGLGFMFAADDPFFGVDLDGCRDPETGAVDPWAKDVIARFNTYAELSPSESGVKLFGVGRWPFDTGRNLKLPGSPRGGKQPGIEGYDRLRYFAVTGWRLSGQLAEPQERQDALGWLKATYWPDESAAATPSFDWHGHDAVVERARKYLEKMPAAVSGQNGHGQTFRAACVLALGFELSEADAFGLLQEYSARCQPPWSDRELRHKVQSAARQAGRRGYLRDAKPETWAKIAVPAYREPVPPPPEPTVILLADAAATFVESVAAGGNRQITTSVPDLDYALGGGVEKGEMVIYAARPSHGKSAMALQSVHEWTEQGMPCAIVSEEMSALMLGKRTIQFASRVPEEHWPDQVDRLRADVADYRRWHKDCVILEGCGTTAVACERIERAVADHGVQAAVVDYAQLLRSEGKSRYEQITNTSIRLRQLATQQKIILLVLCQLNREIENRPRFQPQMSDLKDSGQLEQDADVIVFLCWPHRINPAEPTSKYQFFVTKNRNRMIRKSAVMSQFNPDRQLILDAPAAWDQSEDTYPARGSHV